LLNSIFKNKEFIMKCIPLEKIKTKENIEKCFDILDFEK